MNGRGVPFIMINFSNFENPANRSELVSPLSIRKKGKTKTKNIHVKGKVEIGWLFVNYKSLTRAILHAQ